MVDDSPPTSAAAVTAEAEIAAARAQTATTRRASVAAIEEILFEPLAVLDLGFIRVVDYMGDDGAIVQAARVSYGRGTKRVSDDRNLIRYLMRHRHSTPFEMCELKLHVKLPIFVARQWIRHRTANVNEYSARYSILDREFYLPQAADLGGPPETNRQGRGAPLTAAGADAALQTIAGQSAAAYATSAKLLGLPAGADDTEEETTEGSATEGLARELARMVLPTNFYTQWYWKIDLHNLFHFLSLRADPHAQAEIRAYALKLCEVVEKWVPLAYEAFRDYRIEGAGLSGPALKVLRRMLAGEEVALAGSGLSKREWTELMATLGR